MATSTASQKTAAPIVVQDKGSASGKIIVWPGSQKPSVVYDECSASGMVIIWSRSSSSTCSALGQTTQASMASTRANSPDGSSTEEDAECDMPSPRNGFCGGSSNVGAEKNLDALGLRGGTRVAMLKDLSVEVDCDKGPGSPPTTVAGSPYPSSVASQTQSSTMPCTPSSSISASPGHLTATCPSRSSPLSSLSPCDASQRLPPQHVVQRMKAGLSTIAGDASHRAPASRPYTAAVGSWAAATAAVAATRAAAVSSGAPAQTMIGAPTTLGAVNHPYADTAVLAQAASPIAVTSTVPHTVSVIAAGALGPHVAEDASPLGQAATFGTPCVEAYTADCLRRWLAGVSEDSPVSSEDLAERLRTALPETYDD